MPNPNGKAPDEPCQEQLFHWLLSIEHRRCVRSNRPLNLLLVDTGRPGARLPRLDHVIAQRLLTTVKTSLRRTDVVGWYRRDSVVGAILAESRNDLDPSAALQRLTEALERRFSASVTPGVRVRLHRYSEQHETETSRTEQSHHPRRSTARGILR